MEEPLLTLGRNTEKAKSPPDVNSITFLSKNILRKALPENSVGLEQKMILSLENCQVKINSSIIFLLKKCCKLMYEEEYMQCLKFAEQIIDFSWEKLNSFHWKDVPIVWQRVYSFGCLFKSCSIGLMSEAAKYEDVCRVADMGLLMGENILDGVLHNVVAAFKPPRHGPPVMQQLMDSNQDYLGQNGTLRNNIIMEHIPSLDTFKNKFMDSGTPALLNGCLKHWPAKKLWTFPYLSDVAGHRLVPVELGSKYTDNSWGQKLMMIDEFITKYIMDETNTTKAYLAQHRLFNQIPELKNDIVIPDYCCISDLEDCDVDVDTEINAWFGPRGTVSPCHFDIKHNLLAQVVGRKLVYLYPASCAEALYPHDGMLNNTSQVDVENPDGGKFPNFIEMDELNRVEFILHPGQLLYIPPGYWHYIKSLDKSFSVSFWWN